jgi:hypothetical protein
MMNHQNLTLFPSRELSSFMEQYGLSTRYSNHTLSLPSSKESFFRQTMMALLEEQQRHQRTQEAVAITRELLLRQLFPFERSYTSSSTAECTTITAPLSFQRQQGTENISSSPGATHTPAPPNIPTATPRSTESKDKSKNVADEWIAAKALMNLSPQEVQQQQQQRAYSHLIQEPPQVTHSLRPVMPLATASTSAAARRILLDPLRRPSCSSTSSVTTNGSTEASSTGSLLAAESSSSQHHQPPALQSTWHPGQVSLSLDEDDDALSELHCFMRRYCVQVFSASAEDVAIPRYGRSKSVKVQVQVGQVGIRCLYCSHKPTGARSEGAISYPSSLKNIYHSIETWQRRHFPMCEELPAAVRERVANLVQESKSHAGGRRQYWEDSAKRLGMMDTPDQGLRFSRPPGILTVAPPTREGVHESALHANLTQHALDQHQHRPSLQHHAATPIVVQEDKHMVTDYLFLLLEQMQTCHFTEQDRIGGRSKTKDISVGFPGIQCKHCCGKAGMGRYFPSNVHTLALGNSDRNVFNHLQKCRKCPPLIKQALTTMGKDQSHTANKRGLRKLFFQRVWERVHSDSC